MRIEVIKGKLPNGFVEIHNQAFKDFFLTSLGESFLKLYYTSIMKSSKGLVICMFDDNENVVGFSAGTLRSKGFHKKILFSNKFAYLYSLFYLLIFRSRAIYRLIKNLSKNKSSHIDDGNYAELLSIAIPPKYKGLGYGKILIQEFEKELKIHKINKVALTTDFYDNKDVLAFYNKVGYGIFYDFITYPNRKMYKLIKNI